MSTSPQTAGGRRPSFFRSPIFWLGLVAMIVAVPLGRMLLNPPAPPLPVVGTLPAFKLTDQEERSFDDAAMKDRVWIANFIFTSCPTVCPLLTAKMARLQEQTKEQGDALRLVSFSVDPYTDTPAVLKEYGAKFGQDPARWTFLTGPYTDIERAIQDGFKIAIDRQEPDEGGFYDIVHGEHFVLVDATGQLRGYYRSEAPELERLVRDAVRLVKEGGS